MRKLTEYCLCFFAWLNVAACFAVDKFDILPDLPEPIQKVEASTISGVSDSGILGNQSVGHEPSLISVVFSLLLVILLIYITGIIYAKLNKLGFHTLKKQQGELAKTQVAVVSTTPLGGNKTLHVVELDGKRMLIGAAAGNIQLLKDLGTVDKGDENEEFSHIEIPNIKIPKIEIPKIEIPTIGFSKLMTKAHQGIKDIIREESIDSPAKDIETMEEAKEETKEKTHDENPNDIIDSLFNQESAEKESAEVVVTESEKSNDHTVDPEGYALYKKYLG